MLTLMAILIFLLVAGTTWLVGFWNNLISLFSLIIAGLVATSYFEPLADLIEGAGSTYTYMLDFVAIWLLFIVTFVVLRVACEYLSRFQVAFVPAIEWAGRISASVVIGCVFVCFSVFTLHLAPLPPDCFSGSFQETPEARNAIVGPDAMWYHVVKYQSKWSLAEFDSMPSFSEYDVDLSDADQDSGVRVFDSVNQFSTTYLNRRKVFTETTEAAAEDGGATLRVLRGEE